VVDDFDLGLLRIVHGPKRDDFLKLDHGAVRQADVLLKDGVVAQ